MSIGKSHLAVVPVPSVPSVGLVLLGDDSYVAWGNQAGGYYCAHPWEEGVWVPLSFSFLDGGVEPGPNIEESLLDGLGDVFEGNHVGWCGPGDLSSNDADEIDKGFVGLKIPLRVDRDRLAESMEAWVYVVLTGYPRTATHEHAVLVWENSD